jgi:hypothetical protein
MNAARRLATILAPDVIGYSRLMGEDEAAGTRSAVQRQFLARNQNRLYSFSIRRIEPAPAGRWARRANKTESGCDV